MTSADKLKLVKDSVEKALIEAGFELQHFSIQIEDDENHTAKLKVLITPELVKNPEEKHVDSLFDDIVNTIKDVDT